MNLSDKEILELNELCNALVDGSITDKQKAELGQRLSASADARQFYVRIVGQSASLFSYASEMQTGERDAVASSRGNGGRRWMWMIGLLSIAACVVVLLWMRPPRSSPTRAEGPAVGKIDDNEFVARLTGSKECVWVDSASVIPPGGRLRKGQQVELVKGFAEITFDSGAQVLLQGPALLNVNSAWSATLKRGALKASFPPEAMGFSISNPTVEVVDLGTEFTMFADTGGTASDVLVLKGEVEAAPRTSGDPQPFVLREKECRRFAASGVSNVGNNEQNFGDLTLPVLLDRYDTPLRYAHWSFDESHGALFKAESYGMPVKAADAVLQNVSGAVGAVESLHTPGRWHGALRFDGNVPYARAAFPGISGNSPHTIAFWVKVPRDANLSSAYAMVAWAANRKEFGSHPFQIVWNRFPNEGQVGVLRTDYGGGFALGATPLRDGRWHHIAVVFIPGDDSTGPIEVKQYVDGRLEGEGKPSTPGSDRFMNSTEENPQAASGTIWLGCRLGIRDVRTARFCGEIDELFIADRALEPQEIVRLINTNQLDE